MRYCGSKRRFAPYIVPILESNLTDDSVFVDMCCGGCSILSEVNHRNKIGIDSNHYVISLWRKLQRNVRCGHPSDNIPYEITEEQYKSIKESYMSNDGRWDDYVIGYVGNALSYGSSWFNGFAKTNLNKRNSLGIPENHCHEAFNGLMRQLKEFKFLNETSFIEGSFEEYDFNDGRHYVIYADPPYFNTKKYKDDFNHERFWEWCREMHALGHKIFVSEYEMPNDFKCIWQKEKKDGMELIKSGSKQNTKIEKLFTL